MTLPQKNTSFWTYRVVRTKNAKGMTGITKGPLTGGVFQMTLNLAATPNGDLGGWHVGPGELGPRYYSPENWTAEEALADYIDNLALKLPVHDSKEAALLACEAELERRLTKT